ncbi:uncharacterized protein LACBIDRAFT_328441 [Laccaria bicolor S238N-H82]|uniref:Predicted protein n=1 Tax=Laccaria bicolor (strain S238N-H82 / ATCC MYA-4686) TaxID=486041 RepID=B0DEU3_LACBS|nr:uncharacterized protein LACBIDRAFT_328441 [Laccaria bicolor S238N-H82]EDR06728.1 predicted protein [Laccaria bicolor S238N-H82]|eukprot:XP_001882575.1 predicted protein [Laccaria bicolor S238N-H82]
MEPVEPAMQSQGSNMVPMSELVFDADRCTPVSKLIAKFWSLINNLPESVPEALADDPLAIFEEDPKSFDDLSLDAEELWEVKLNGLLKAVLGWGVDQSMDGMIQRGQKGVDGLAKFVEYFIMKHGGKLLHLLGELEKLPLTHTNTTTVPMISSKPSSIDITQSDRMDISTLLCQGSAAASTKNAQCTIIDIDSFEEEKFPGQLCNQQLTTTFADGVYKLKSFTEEEDMKALLLWKLAGNCVAEINHQANGAQSVSCLRTWSTVPPIVPFHAWPTVDEVHSNVNVILQGILEVMHQRIGSSIIHAAVFAVYRPVSICIGFNWFMTGL